MYTKKLTPAKMILFIALVMVTIVMIIFRVIQSREPIVLNARYLNEEVLMDIIISEVVGQIEVQENMVVCLCSTPDNQLASIYLEKTKHGYSMRETHFVAINLLTGIKYQYNEFDPFLSDHKDLKVFYAVYLNPQDETILVNDASVPIQKIKLDINEKELEIGFWGTAIPKDTEIEFGLGV